MWTTFYNRYPFFDIRGVDWQEQYERYRPEVTAETTDEELFDILCGLLAPLNDGHVTLTATMSGKTRHFCPEKKPRFWQEFNDGEIEELLRHDGKDSGRERFRSAGWNRGVDASLLPVASGWLHAHPRVGRVLKHDLVAALDAIARDFRDLSGYIIDIRNCPGGDDSTAITIINRFCDRRRVAFHRRTKIGPGDNDLTPARTWYIEPHGDVQFRGPIVLLTCDSVFSGGEAFALAIGALPYVTIVGDHTNGIFSYELEKTLPNDWNYTLSYQKYYSSDMVCYEGKGVPVDIELLNEKADIEVGIDPLITRALELVEVWDTPGSDE